MTEYTSTAAGWWRPVKPFTPMKSQFVTWWQPISIIKCFYNFPNMELLALFTSYCSMSWIMLIISLSFLPPPSSPSPSFQFSLLANFIGYEGTAKSQERKGVPPSSSLLPFSLPPSFSLTEGNTDFIPSNVTVLISETQVSISWSAVVSQWL